MTEEWAPRGIDPFTPSTARMYDYYLGGKDNYDSDRQAAQRVIEQIPDLPEVARRNRAFLGRAVAYMAEHGIRQFLDIGTGLPTQRNVHTVAHEIAPDARVVYVDNDPVVLTHARALMQESDSNVTVVDADMLEPETLLERVDGTGVIDWSRPVGLLFVAVLHFTDDAAAIVDTMRQRLAPGSHIAISHVSADRDPDQLTDAAREYDKATSAITFRTSSEIRALFDGFALLDPGVVPVQQCTPGQALTTPVDSSALGYAGVAELAG